MKKKNRLLIVRKRKMKRETHGCGTGRRRACNGGSTCAVAHLFPCSAPSMADRIVIVWPIVGHTVCTGLAAQKKSDAKPEAHSAAHDGVIDSTDDGRGTLRNTAPF